MARVVEEPLARARSPAELDRLVDDAARDRAGAVTIMAPDGRVLADSAASGAELAALENHAARPEVEQALAGGPRRPHAAQRDRGRRPAVRRGADPRAAAGCSACRGCPSPRRVEQEVARLRRVDRLGAGLAFLLTVAPGPRALRVPGGPPARDHGRGAPVRRRRPRPRARAWTARTRWASWRGS